MCNDLADVAVELGYTFVRKGCPCMGNNQIYKRESKRGGHYELHIWPIKGIWRLIKANSLLDKGNVTDAKEKLIKWD